MGLTAGMAIVARALISNDNSEILLSPSSFTETGTLREEMLPPLGLQSVYISIRSDGLTGSGSFYDPFDGSTAAKFDAAMASISQPAKVILGPGTFLTDEGVQFNGEMEGAGQGQTVIKLADNPSRDYIFVVAIGIVGGPTSYLHDLTVDGNGVNQGLNAFVGCVKIYGVGTMVKRVGVQGYATKPGWENFVISSVNDICTLIEDCYIGAPANVLWPDGCTQISTTQSGAIVRRNYFAPSTSGSGLGQPAYIHQCTCYGAQWKVLENYFDATNGIGFYNDSPPYSDGLIENNIFNNISLAVWLKGDGDTSRVKIFNNMIETANGNGISVDLDADPILAPEISGNTIRCAGATNKGVYINKASFTVVENNIIDVPDLNSALSYYGPQVSFKRMAGNRTTDGTTLDAFDSNAGAIGATDGYGIVAQNGLTTVNIASEILNRLRYPPRFLGGGWSTATVGGGTASVGGPRSNAETASSATNPSSGMVYQTWFGIASIYGVSPNNVAAFNRAFSVAVNFFANGIVASPNTVYRFSLGKPNPPSPGAPTVRAVGFKLVFDTTNTGHFFGEVHNGTTLTVSSSSRASLDLSNTQIIHQVIIHTDGAGTVKFYLNGTLIDTLTGGPTAAGGGTLTLENYNTGDATAAGAIYTSDISLYMEG